jgi:hypothetical protein
MRTPSKGRSSIQPTMPTPKLVAKFHLSVTGVSDVLEILAQHGVELALRGDREVVGAIRRTPPRKPGAQTFNVASATRPARSAPAGGHQAGCEVRRSGRWPVVTSNCPSQHVTATIQPRGPGAIRRGRVGAVANGGLEPGGRRRGWRSTGAPSWPDVCRTPGRPASRRTTAISGAVTSTGGSTWPGSRTRSPKPGCGPWK